MAKVEDDVLAEFFRKIEADERIPDETAEALRRLLAADEDPNVDALVSLLDATTGERLA